MSRYDDERAKRLVTSGDRTLMRTATAQEAAREFNAAALDFADEARKEAERFIATVNRLWKRKPPA